MQAQVLLIMRQQFNPDEFKLSGNISEDDMSSDLESPFKTISKAVLKDSAEVDMVVEKLVSLYGDSSASVKVQTLYVAASLVKYSKDLD
jgi:hypothetical protein